MPIYTYRTRREQKGCDYCSDSFEISQSMSEERLQKCPRCGSEIERIITGCNFVQGHNFGDALTRERMKRGGLRKMVRTDDGSYRDDTPK